MTKVNIIINYTLFSICIFSYFWDFHLDVLALKQYSKAIQKAPTNDVLFTNRALCKIKLKKFDDACADAREAIQLSQINVKGCSSIKGFKPGARTN